MDPLLRVALDAADAAVRVHQRWARRLDTEGADEKGASDYVSRADREAQDAALAVIRSRFPGHRVVAEEDDSSSGELGAGDGTPVWIVDPLDGTTNFLHGVPAYAASVAVAVDGRPEAGVVSSGPTGERWWAKRGGGAWKDGRPCRVSSRAEIGKAVVGTGFPFKSLHQLEDYKAQFGRILRSTAGIRRGGSAALDLAYLAEGRFDAFWELFLRPWDFAAGMLLVEEAGGVMAAPDRGPLALGPGGVVGACSREMMDALFELIEGVG